MAARFVIGLYRCASLNRVFTPVTATTTIIPHVSDVRILCRNFSAEAEEEVKEVVKHVRQIVPVEVSMKYINSKGDTYCMLKKLMMMSPYMYFAAYVTAYGKDPVWKKYKRNFKGQWAPETRKTCIRGDKISGNPCPICRDEYLVLNYMNIELLKQFISPYDGGILSTMQVL